MNSAKLKDTKSTQKKLVVFLYINNEQSIKEILKNQIYNSFKTIKYFGINWTKEVKDLYTVDHKTLLKERRYKWVGMHPMFIDWKTSNIF